MKYCAVYKASLGISFGLFVFISLVKRVSYVTTHIQHNINKANKAILSQTSLFVAYK